MEDFPESVEGFWPLESSGKRMGGTLLWVPSVWVKVIGGLLLDVPGIFGNHTKGIEIIKITNATGRISLVK